MNFACLSTVKGAHYVHNNSTYPPGQKSYLKICEKILLFNWKAILNFWSLKPESLNSSVLSICVWPQKYAKLPWNSVIIFHTVFLVKECKALFLPPLIYTGSYAGITGALVPHSNVFIYFWKKKCGHLFKIFRLAIERNF